MDLKVYDLFIQPHASLDVENKQH